MDIDEFWEWWDALASVWQMPEPTMDGSGWGNFVTLWKHEMMEGLTQGRPIMANLHFPYEKPFHWPDNPGMLYMTFNCSFGEVIPSSSPGASICYDPVMKSVSMGNRPAPAHPGDYKIHILTIRCGRCCACFKDPEATCDWRGGHVKYTAADLLSMTVLPDGQVRIQGKFPIPLEDVSCSVCGSPLISKTNLQPAAHITFA